MLGTGKPCVLTLVERTTGYVMIGKLRARTVVELNRVALGLITSTLLPVETITADNGTEFHGYRALEEATRVRFYFATPHHSWERGSSENTNGLIRQYRPKRTSMARLTQPTCNRIADRLNNRPRKRLNFHTPKEAYDLLRS
jgi:IS30 family transposase